MKSKENLSVKDIQERVTSKQDRTTIYRALTTFLEKGLIYKIPNVNNVSRYALCLKENPEHNHAHFVCCKCHKTFCMHEIEIPVFNNIEGFKVMNTKLTLEGYCSDCACDSNE